MLELPSQSPIQLPASLPEPGSIDPIVGRAKSGVSSATAGTSLPLASDVEVSFAADIQTERDRSLVRGVAWTSILTWLSQLLAWGATLFVAHHLAPADYGLIGLATLYLGFLSMASDLGVGAAVVRFRDLSRDQVSQFNSLALMAGVACVFLSLGAAYPLARFFSEPRLPAIMAVMSTSYLITAFRVVPQATLQRKLDFRWLAIIDATVAVVGALAAVTMAVLGFGYWTLALAPIIAAAVFTVLVVARGPIGFRRPVLDSVRQPLRFSGDTLLTRLIWYAFSNADFFVIGRFLGKASLGAYTLGWVLSGIAVEKITALIGRITPAFFSSVQHDPAELRRYLLLTTQGLSLLTFPAAIGMAVVADDVVHAALGDGWSSAVAPLRYLAILATLRSIQPLISQILSALGETRLNLRNAVMSVCVLPIAFYLATRWGITGVSIAWLVLAPLLFLPLFQQARRRINLSTREYLACLWPATSGSAAMALVVLSVSWLLRGTVVWYVELVIKVLVGVVVYVATLLMFHHAGLSTMRDLFRLARHPPPVPSPGAP